MSALRPAIAAPAREPAVPLVVGLRGLWLVLPIAALLAAGAGGREASLLVLGPIVTYGLSLIVMVAFWWEDWPGTRLGPNWSGWADTLLIAAGAVLLTACGQAISSGLDVSALFDPSPGPGRVPTFPVTLPLAAAVFVVMLEFTLVGEGWPLRRLPAVAGGPLALAGSWAVGLALYFALVRAGAVAGADFGAALVCVGAWQVLCFVVWRGAPTSRIAARAARLGAAHALVVGGGVLTFVLARAWLAPATVTAVAGCFVAAGLAVGMLLEVPVPIAPATGATVLAAAALFVALSALADGLPRGEDWVAHASLNALPASMLLHVAVGRRWPFRTEPDRNAP